MEMKRIDKDLTVRFMTIQGDLVERRLSKKDGYWYNYDKNMPTIAGAIMCSFKEGIVHFSIIDGKIKRHAEDTMTNDKYRPTVFIIY